MVSRATGVLHRAVADWAERRIGLADTTIIQNTDHVAAPLHRLRVLGIGLGLDDFGTGYASRDYLQALPFTCLRIDKAFVQQINQSERSLHTIKAALGLAAPMPST